MTTLHTTAAIETETVGELLTAVASRDPTPGGGSVSALVAGLASGLAAMAARFTVARDGDDSPHASTVERADELRRRAVDLAGADVAAYERWTRARRIPSEDDPEGRRAALDAARDAAASVPADLARLAAQIARLGQHLAESGSPALRSDAVAATTLAGAVATNAAVLVRNNLHHTPDDPRLPAATAAAREAALCARRALSTTDLALEEGGAP